MLQVIELVFLDLALENDRSCRFDSLTVFDGENVDAHALGTFCGFEVPPPVLTHGNTATLLLTSDHSITEAGFSLEYFAREMTCKWNIFDYGFLTRYVKLRVAHAPGMPGTFFPPPRISYPDMHHGTCVTHVPWCMPGSLTSGFLWSRWRGKRSWYYWRMRNPQFSRIW